MIFASAVHLLPGASAQGQHLQQLSGVQQEQPAGECEAIPRNVHVQGRLVAAVTRLIEQSRTFRRQCAVIEATPAVTVFLRLSGSLGPFVRARAEIARLADGRVTATIDVPVSRELPELIAHEFEHVLEFLGGVQLRQLARQRASGVREVGAGAFESLRAIVAGRNVAVELEGFKRGLSALSPRQP